MKSALYNGASVYEYREIGTPACPLDGLLVKVGACAICGTDLKILKQADVKIEDGKMRRMALPRITGHELAGIIEEVGGDISGFTAGERVTVAPTVPCGKCSYCQNGNQEMCENVSVIGYDTDGGFAEYLSVNKNTIDTGCVNKIPENVSLDAAALTEPLSCVINCLEITPIRMGDAVVIIGAGPMGSFFINLARVQGAGKAFLVEISESRLAIARDVLEKIGTPADAYINSAKEDLLAFIREQTNGRGADVVITACPSGEAQKQAVELVAKKGKVNFFGGLPRNNSVVPIDTNLIHYKECIVAGTHGSAPRHNRVALGLIARGIVPAGEYITHRFTLEKIMDGVGTVRAGKGLKVVINP